MRTILLRKILKYYATNTDSINRIARGHKNFLEIKPISKREEGEGYVYLKNTAIILDHIILKKLEFIYNCKFSFKL